MQRKEIRSYRELELMNALGEALDREQLRLCYQPIYGASGRLRGFEALLRWDHADYGPVSPAEFVPLAEQSLQIVPIGEWVIHEACRMLHAANNKGLGILIMSVNVSTLQLQSPGFVETVLRILDSTNTPPQCLELEITEGIRIDSRGPIITNLCRLRDAGVRIALDDFGEGHTSFAYLRLLPLHTLKLDRSFIEHLCDSSRDRIMVESLITLIHRLGLEVVAEGIEDSGQLKLLQEWNCDFHQGYLLGMPLEGTGIGPHLLQSQLCASIAAWGCPEKSSIQ
ncbi:EAL domain-containing protein [Paenibacillus oenotherae]|uniref:EAL domain-containing protein n=1 Tax=Paenibacillus oenotherae TaxID=1435645 RepID=A0ABS7D7W6_9BACL|nr:EAL domain-containing protein [Paenibacillus oenotherae]MBW7476024.1 EAL domain-containing protein [Paenibacillus oenotherae]